MARAKRRRHAEATEIPDYTIRDDYDPDGDILHGADPSDRSLN